MTRGRPHDECETTGRFDDHDGPGRNLFGAACGLRPPQFAPHPHVAASENRFGGDAVKTKEQVRAVSCVSRVGAPHERIDREILDDEQSQDSSRHGE